VSKFDWDYIEMNHNKYESEKEEIKYLYEDFIWAFFTNEDIYNKYNSYWKYLNKLNKKIYSWENNFFDNKILLKWLENFSINDNSLFENWVFKRSINSTYKPIRIEKKLIFSNIIDNTKNNWALIYYTE